MSQQWLARMFFLPTCRENNFSRSGYFVCDFIFDVFDALRPDIFPGGRVAEQNARSNSISDHGQVSLVFVGFVVGLAEFRYRAVFNN